MIEIYITCVVLIFIATGLFYITWKVDLPLKYIAKENNMKDYLSGFEDIGREIVRLVKETKIGLVYTLLACSMVFNIYIMYILNLVQSNTKDEIAKTWAIVEEKNRQMLKRELEFRADLKEIDSLLKKALY